MTREIDQVRQLFASFRQADELWQSAEPAAQALYEHADQEWQRVAEHFDQRRSQLIAIPQTIGTNLANQRQFLVSHAIEAPHVTPTPISSDHASLPLLEQQAALANDATTLLRRIRNLLPQLVHVRQGVVKRRRPALFTHDIEAQDVPEFWIGETLVTNRQYHAFLAEFTGQVAPPSNWPGGRYAAGSDDHPVTQVSYDDACAYCRWAGLQLPSATQWLRAARGDTLHAYPWGDASAYQQFTNAHEMLNQPDRAVGKLAGDRSPFGVRDMLLLSSQWLAQAPAGRPGSVIARDHTLDNAVSSGVARAGIRVVRTIDAAAPAIARRSLERPRWGRIGIMLALVALVALGIYAGHQYSMALVATQSTRATALASTAAAAAAAATADVIEATAAAEQWSIRATAAVEFATAAALQAASGGVPDSSTEWVTVPAGDGIAAFRISRTEVSNAQYARCVSAGACTPPQNTTSYDDEAYAQHPVVNVTREQARAYAAWIGGSLPTEAQWLRACRGDDGRTYPWGSTSPDETQANYAWPGRTTFDSAPVEQYPAGASPSGALNMVGNVWEWTESDDGSNRFIVRGGAFNNRGSNVTCDARFEFEGGFDYYFGFRVILTDL